MVEPAPWEPACRESVAAEALRADSAGLTGAPAAAAAAAAAAATAAAAAVSCECESPSASTAVEATLSDAAAALAALLASAATDANPWSTEGACGRNRVVWENRRSTRLLLLLREALTAGVAA
jgi:hypothetical protein